jgi:serine protease Do
VAEVFDNTPAAKAGLKPGDILTSIAGKKVRDAKILQGVVADLPLKQSAEVQLVRDGKSVTAHVTIEEQPNDFDNAAAPAQRQPQTAHNSLSLSNFGIDVADLNDTMSEDFGFKSGTKGAVITRVEPGSIAADAGLRKGTLIAKVDNHGVTTAAQAQQRMQAGSLQRGVLLQVHSPQGGTNFVLLKNTAVSAQP